MIDIREDKINHRVDILLRGNRSASWADNKRYLAIQIGLSLFFCLPVVIQGYWVILPFMLLSYALLTVCFWMVSHKTMTREGISITENELYYAPPQRGGGELVYSTEFPRRWLQIQLYGINKKCYPKRLEICAYGCRINIGQLLVDSEKVILHKRLQRYCASGFDFQQLSDEAENIRTQPAEHDYMPEI